MDRKEYRRFLKKRLEELACEELGANKVTATHLDIEATTLSGGEWVLGGVTCRISENTSRAAWSEDAGRVIMSPVRVLYAAFWDGVDFTIEEKGVVNR